MIVYSKCLLFDMMLDYVSLLFYLNLKSTITLTIQRLPAEAPKTFVILLD